MTLIATFALLALTRAEIIQRMRAPVVTQADGLVQVFADCPEDMRREFQSPVATFASETMRNLYQAESIRPRHFSKPGVMIHLGDVRTNLTAVSARVATNDARFITRIYLKSPGYADIESFRDELVKAFYRAVCGREIAADEARRIYRRTDPQLRIADARASLENWLAGRRDLAGRTPAEADEEGLVLMRKVFEPGKASRRDVLIFASRLYLYPAHYASPFLGRYTSLSFREAMALASRDLRIRLAALQKADEPLIFGVGRGESLASAARAYSAFLRLLADPEAEREKLAALLEEADTLLNIAFEKSVSTVNPVGKAS